MVQYLCVYIPRVIDLLLEAKQLWMYKHHLIMSGYQRMAQESFFAAVSCCYMYFQKSS